MSCACNNQSRFLYELGNCDPISETGRAPDSLNTHVSLWCGPDRDIVCLLPCVIHVEFCETPCGTGVIRGSLIETKFPQPLSVRSALRRHGSEGCDLVAEHQPDESKTAPSIVLYRLKNCYFTDVAICLDSEDMVFSAVYTFTATELVEGE